MLGVIPSNRQVLVHSTDWTYKCKDSGLRLTVLRVFVLFAVRHGQPHRRPEGHRAKSARHCGLGMHQESLKPPWSTVSFVLCDLLNMIMYA